MVSDVVRALRPSLGFAYIGSFTTTERRARGRGIDGFRIDRDAALDGWDPVGSVDQLDNPSYLIGDPRRRILYAAHGDRDYASALAADVETGCLRPLGQASTGGSNVVHLALAACGRFLVVANYGSGSVAVLPVRFDGAIGPATHVLPLSGALGPHRKEQAGSHPHHIVFDPTGAFVLVPDKGLDAVFVLAFAPISGRLSIVQQLPMRPGAGPRHIVFHPRLPLAFLVNEIESSVASLRWDAMTGMLTPVHLVSTLPPTFFGASTAAAIVVTPCGRFVYASNRGQDGIVRLAVDETNGLLGVIGWTPSGGADPRFMCLDVSGQSLLVANEQGDNLASFAIDQQSGDLHRTGSRASSSPSTIAFL